MSPSVSKVERERRIFETLLPLTGMRLVPNSLRQEDPPAPDIECQIEQVGPFAVELVALDAEETRTRLTNMQGMDEAWNRALMQWSSADQARLRQYCTEVFLSLDVASNAGNRARAEIMKAIQKKLLSTPTHFEGELFTPWDRPTGLAVARVHRGGVMDGPRISAPSAGSWCMPQVDKIREKLVDKSYRTSAPLELFAYSTHDDVDAHVDSRNAIDECVRRYLPGSQFRRVRVFNLAFQQLKYTYPQVDAVDSSDELNSIHHRGSKS
jgi:hypothetical protein